MDLANTFTDVLLRNALRREAGLPPLDIRAEVEKGRYVLALAKYHEGFERHKDELERIKARLREDGTDNPRTVPWRALAEYRVFLAQKGFPCPVAPTTITYGSDRG